ncbi:MAG: NAD(P)H-binding protein [Parvibaculaceae bacterium]|nr:NAD(P)H-binding protein [Parvibaculaceae bacterium]
MTSPASPNPTADQGSRIAWIAGASGLIGSSLLPLLLSSSAYDEVVAFGRRPVKLEHPKLRQVVVEADTYPTVTAELAPPLHAYCALGTTHKKSGRDGFYAVDHDLIVAFATAARARGAHGLALVSSVGADPDSSNFYLRVKGETERDVAALGFDRCRLFQPSLLLGNRSEVRLAETAGMVAAPLLSLFLHGPTRRYRAIHANQVARALYASLQIEASPQGVMRPQYDEIIKLSSRR